MVKYSELDNLNFSAKLDIIIYILKAKTKNIQLKNHMKYGGESQF